MSGLQTFDFGGRTVRTAGTHEAPLFCAADVCAVLGLSDVSILTPVLKLVKKGGS